ncbi:N-acetylmuramoyl-L-alanine amidase [Romboutsia ilealis]|uniref:N-acetylmuramoyl-L-alanine amidase n=1 Tax=Romboutsia ilealis TaxID=1115758 RepID=UPI00272B4EA6|nr:N-acetylmuramoyl-L-alanine amidase [Romboutsia ilealis]
MSKNLLIIDAGHNEYVAGKRSPDSSLLEWEFNDDMQRRVKKRSEEHGIEVFLTNPSPAKKNEIGLSTRCNLANNYWKNQGKPTCLFLSIHANALDDSWSSANGTETYVCNNCSNNSVKAAKLIQNQLVKDLGTRDRGVKYNNYYVLKNTSMSGCLAEVAFYSNKTEVEILKHKRNEITEAFVKAICAYFNITYIPPKSSNTTTTSQPSSNNSKFVKGDYNKPVKVTANELTVRSGRGVEFKELGILKKGEVVEIWHINTAKDGGLWGSLGYNGETGFINMSYVEPTNEKPKPVETLKPIQIGEYNAPLKVTADSLRVRAGRGTGFKEVSTLKKGEIIDAWTIDKGDDGKLWTSFRYAPSSTPETKGVGFCSCEYLEPCIK